MKKIWKQIAVCLLISIFCIGCGKTNEAKEIENLENIFKEYPDTFVDQEKKENGATIQLHHVAFEARRMILDYTVKTENLEAYRYCQAEVSSDVEGSMNCSLDCSLYFEEEQNEYHMIALYAWKDGKLQQEDVGKTVQIQLLFPQTFVENIESDSIDFEVELSRIFETKQIELHQDIVYDQGTTSVEGLEISPFYTRLIMNHSENEDFLNGFFGYEIVDEEDHPVSFKGGADDSLFYGGLPENCSRAGITVIQYMENSSYEFVSDKLEVEIP